MTKIQTLLAGLATSVALLASQACSPANASPTPAVEVLQSLPSLNSAGDSVFASLVVSHASGVTTTVTTGGTFYALGGTPMALGEADGSGCLTATVTGGVITVAKRCGVGKLRLTACINDVIGTAGKTMQARLHRVRGDTTTAIGPIAIDLEDANNDAGLPARGSMGCIDHVVDAALGDTYALRYTSTSNSDTLVTRNASLVAQKLLNK